jgi:phasin family protein
MQKELIEQWGEFTKTAFDSLRELGEINTKLVGRLSQQQLEILNTSLEAAVQETHLVSESKDYKQLLSGQSTLTAEYNRKFLEIVRKTTDILEETREELTGWLEKGVENVERGVEQAQRNVAAGVEQARQAGPKATRTERAPAGAASKN